MKIYFAGSVRAGREDKELYLKIINHLARYGQVLTEHIGDQNLTEQGEALSNKEIYARDVSWIREADVLVAEVSTPSLGIGYEIAQAESMGKDILCLYRNQDGKRLSAMIDGNPNPRLIVSRYAALKDAPECIDKFLSSLDYNKKVITETFFNPELLEK